MSGRWKEHPVRASTIKDQLGDFLAAQSRWDNDLYFCPNAFSESRRKKEFALRTEWGWCDIDESNPEEYRPQPSILWSTSPGRTQGLWRWSKVYRPERAEDISCALAKRHGGDDGWSITKMLRIPGSINHKPDYNEPIVRLRKADLTALEPPPVMRSRRRSKVQRPKRLTETSASASRDEIIKKYESRIHLKAQYLLRHDGLSLEDDRSNAIYFLTACLFEAGASDEEIVAVLSGSRYAREKFGGDLNTIWTDVTRIISKLEGSL